MHSNDSFNQSNDGPTKKKHHIQPTSSIVWLSMTFLQDPMIFTSSVLLKLPIFDQPVETPYFAAALSVSTETSFIALLPVEKRCL